jgi:hypothetical protein
MPTPRPQNTPPGQHWLAPDGRCSTCGARYVAATRDEAFYWEVPDGGRLRFEPSCWFVAQHRRARREQRT